MSGLADTLISSTEAVENAQSWEAIGGHGADAQGGVTVYVPRHRVPHRRHGRYDAVRMSRRHA
jgi:hypothetical protein